MQKPTLLLDDIIGPDLLPAERRERSRPRVVEFPDRKVDPAFDAMVQHVLSWTDLPPARLRHLRDAYVYNDVVFCWSGERLEPLDGTWRPQDQPSRGGQSFIETANALVDQGGFIEIERCFYIGSAGSSNYGHWLVDDLPRVSLARAQIEMLGLPLVFATFGAAIDSTKMQTLRMVLPDNPAMAIDRMSMTHVHDLHVVDPISIHPVLKSRFAIEMMTRQIAEATKTLEEQVPRRIFVDRSGQRRSIVNRAEIVEDLERLDFHLIRPEELTFEQQARFFAGADLVVGTMGAAMTNIVFCKPTAIPIFLAPDGWNEPFYWDLCDTLALPYVVAYGQPAREAQTIDAIDFSVDRGRLNTLVRRFTN